MEKLMLERLEEEVCLECKRDGVTDGESGNEENESVDPTCVAWRYNCTTYNRGLMCQISR